MGPRAEGVTKKRGVAIGNVANEGEYVNEEGVWLRKEGMAKEEVVGQVYQKQKERERMFQGFTSSVFPLPIFFFQIFSFSVFGYTWQYSRATPGSVLRVHSWQCLR